MQPLAEEIIAGNFARAKPMRSLMPLSLTQA